MMSNDFRINKCDKYVYFKDIYNGYGIISLYADDVLILCSDENIYPTKNMIKSNFDVKDMAVVDVILEIKIIKSSDNLLLSQSHYIEKIQ